MTHLFENYAEEDAMFATIEKGGKLCFAGQGHNMLDDGEVGDYGSIIEIWVIFVSERNGQQHSLRHLAQRDRRHWYVLLESCHWLGTRWCHGGGCGNTENELVLCLFKGLHTIGLVGGNGTEDSM